jgi:hypothetical protein
VIEIWLAFYAGQFVRASQRAGHVVAAKEERTLSEYLRKNQWRIVIRVVSSACVFQWVLLPLGWIIVPPVAFMAGFNFEALAEDALNRLKDKIKDKIKNGD